MAVGTYRKGYLPPKFIGQGRYLEGSTCKLIPEE
jgi:hypothetical protein